MAKYIRPSTPPPTHIRVATANASSAPLTSGLLAASAGRADAADSVTHDKADFNGEGHGDVAFFVGNATASGQKNAGDFVTLHQPANGITSAKRTNLSQNATSAPGSSAAGNGFGRVSACGDFNHDGLDDLAIGAEHERVGTDLDGGTVEILQGSACGLPGGATIAGSSHDRWGAVLTASDSNDDAYPMFGANAAN